MIVADVIELRILFAEPDQGTYPRPYSFVRSFLQVHRWRKSLSVRSLWSSTGKTYGRCTVHSTLWCTFHVLSKCFHLRSPFCCACTKVRCLSIPGNVSRVGDHPFVACPFKSIFERKNRYLFFVLTIYFCKSYGYKRGANTFTFASNNRLTMPKNVKRKTIKN